MAHILKRRTEDKYPGNTQRKKDSFPAKAENLLKPYATLQNFSVDSHNLFQDKKSEKGWMHEQLIEPHWEQSSNHLQVVQRCQNFYFNAFKIIILLWWPEDKYPYLQLLIFSSKHTFPLSCRCDLGQFPWPFPKRSWHQCLAISPGHLTYSTHIIFCILGLLTLHHSVHWVFLSLF